MNRLHKQLKSLQHAAALLLLTAMVFQLGACPCGCFEHNAWVQILSFNSSDHDDAIVVAKESCGHSPVSFDDTHDCTGETRTQFVDNARRPRVQQSQSFDTELTLVAADISSSATFAEWNTCRFPSQTRLACTAALYRSALQIYQL